MHRIVSKLASSITSSTSRKVVCSRVVCNRNYGAKAINFGVGARAAMLQGVSEVAEAVKVTMGPKGRNVIIERSHKDPQVTKDGVTVSKSISFKEKAKNVGADLVKQVAIATNTAAGDGTTCATVLTQAILIKGCKSVAAGVNVMDLRSGINMVTRQNPNTQIRNLTVETKDGDFKPNPIQEPSQKAQNEFIEIAKEVSRITRTKPRWEQTLLSDFPSFNFTDPQFFNELIRNQNNVLLSLRFFHWLCSLNGFSPDPLSLTALFDALVEAKACNAAKSFIDYTGFKPEPASLELYIQCLCEGGLVEEAFDVFDRLRGVGVCPSIATWNLALLGCLKVGRTDLVWKLYKEMVESSVVAKVDVETVGYLIRAFCEDNKVSKGYELLRQVLEDGLDPGNAAFNDLISGFCKERQYSKVSELLHTMIAKNRDPDIFTYQEVINGLCKQRKQLEAFRVFNDLKDRGYAPDRVMYTTMIHGLCKMGWLGDARKLWFEMIQKGFIPNEYTYSALIHGYFKVGNLEEARNLYKEMFNRGYRETTVSYNTMIAGLCLNGRTNEAHELFEEMPRKDVVCDVITYNSLIQGFCKEGKIVESTNLLKELLMQGLQPSTSSFSPLIEKLCQAEDIQEAKKLWDDMQSRGLQPIVCTHEHIILALCNQGYAAEGMDRLLAMLKCKLKPKKETFERLIQCLSQSDKWDDILLVLDVMFRIGYTLREGICHSLVNKLCKGNSHFVETHLGEIVE